MADKSIHHGECDLEVSYKSNKEADVWTLELKCSEPVTEEFFIFYLVKFIDEWKKDNRDLMQSARISH